MTEALAELIVQLKRDEVMDAVKDRVEKGESPIRILDECREGMTMVGDRFQEGNYYLAELMLSGEIFKKVMDILEPHLANDRPVKPLGKVVLATMEGDIHDLGKNIVATLLRAHAFEVHDLGVDVGPDLLVEKVRETGAEFIGFSVLITTAFDTMKEAADMLVEAGLRDRVKLMIGGGVTSPVLKEYIGADFQTTDAAKGVEYCLKAIGGK